VVASQEAARRAARILTARFRAALAHDFADQFHVALNNLPDAGPEAAFTLEPAVRYRALNDIHRSGLE